MDVIFLALVEHLSISTLYQIYHQYEGLPIGASQRVT